MGLTKAVPLPVRVSQAKSSNRKTSSRGKSNIVDPRQQTIKNFFLKVKDRRRQENWSLVIVLIW